MTETSLLLTNHPIFFLCFFNFLFKSLKKLNFFSLTGYRCAYCRFYNDSRKKKPGAPQIFASPKPPTSPSSIKSKSPRIFDNSSLPDHFESISRRTTPASSVTGESLPGSEPKDEDKSSDDERVLVDQTSGDHNKVDFAKSLNKDAS